MVKAIIFDFQGTLIENGIYPSPLRQVKNILRIDAPFSDFVMRFEKVMMLEQHVTLKDAFIKACEEFHVRPKDFILEGLVGLWNKNKLLSKLYPDTMPMLADLKQEYKLVLVANIDCFNKDLVDRFMIREYFDIVQLSCDVGMLKSDKGFHEEILKKLGMDADEVLMVGDSLESDIGAAKNVGMSGVLVDRHNKREYDRKIVLLADLRKYL
jgi:FMN phosphatase YigB (HAD superfamily)